MGKETPGLLFFFFYKFIYFILLLSLLFFWLHWVFIEVRCAGYLFSGFSCCGAWALGTRASVVVVHGLSCSAACGIFPNQGSNPCPLHWQADS